MLTKMQMLLIQWILTPLNSVKKRLPQKVWTFVSTVSVLGIVMVQFMHAAGMMSRYLFTFIPFCLFFGLLIVAGLSNDMKPVSFSPVLLICWGVVTLFMLLTGIFVDENVLADTALWLIAFPVFFVVWGNREFKELIKPAIDGIYLSFAVLMVICIGAYPVSGVKYEVFFGNVNSLALYTATVSAVAVIDIFSQKKLCVRMIVADIVLGISSALSYYTASRAGQVAMVLGAVVALVIFLISRREKLWKTVLCFVLPAVLAVAILMPNGAVLINTGHDFMDRYGLSWNKPVEWTPPEGWVPPPVDERTEWQKIQDLNEARKNEGVGQGFDAFSTGRLELWQIYGSEVGLIGNPSTQQLYYANGQMVTKSAHNTLVQMAYEYGLLAAVFFLVFNIVSGLKAIRYAYKKRVLDYSVFPVAIAVVYGAYYMVEKVMYPATILLVLLYLVSQVPLITRKEVSVNEEENSVSLS